MDNTRKLEDKLDRIDSRIDNIDITLARQSEILDIHVKRTNLLEEALKPIENHVAMVNGALKLIGILAMIAAIIEAVVLIRK
jgi:hypothetical protein